MSFRWMVVLGLVAHAPVAYGQPSGGPAAESKTVKVLLIIDSLDPGAAGMAFVKDAEIIEAILKDGFAKSPERLKIDKLAGKDFTRERVLQYYDDMKADPTATLVAFYLGHGATEETDGAILAFHATLEKPNYLRRALLRDVMLSKHPRLAVLLSNTCAGPADFGKRAPVTSRPDWETMRHLFLMPRGVVDINSVSEGEYAALNGYGSPAIVALDDALRQPFATLDLNKDGFLQWQELLPRIQEKSQEGFLLWKKQVIVEQTARLTDEFTLNVAKTQKYQSLRVFSLPPQHRLGLRIIDHKEGPMVLFAHDDTPAAQAGFKSGDILRKIGGQKITSAKDYTEAVSKFEGKVAVEVMRGDSPVTVNVMLAPWPHAGTER
jgi:hypothetical protein